MFEKIELPFDPTYYSKSRNAGDLFTTYSGAINYYTLLDYCPVVARLIRVLSPQGRLYVDLKPGVYFPPHKDHGIVTCMNLYVQAGNQKTTFWKNPKNVQPTHFPGEAEAKIYNKTAELEMAGSFDANPGDIFLLDVNSLHSVNRGVKMREFVTINWRTKTYDEVLESIRKSWGDLTSV